MSGRRRDRPEPPARTDRQPDEGPQAQRRPRAGRPQQDRPRRPTVRGRACSGVDPMRGRHPHHLRPLRRVHHRGARRAQSIRTAAGSSSRSPTTPAGRSAPVHGLSTRRSVTRTSTPSPQSVALGHRTGHDRRHRRPSFVACQRPEARRHAIDYGTATTSSSSSACAPSTTATCSATPRPVRSSRPPSTSSCGWPAGWPPDPDEAIRFYDLISSLQYLPSSPTLFNSGTSHPQMSSVLPARLARGQPRGDLQALHRHRPALEVRRRHRRGLAPHPGQGLAHPGHQRPVQRHRAVAQDPRQSSVAAVNQGGRRKGAACVYLETWHADIEEFLELRDNTGDHSAPHPQPQPGQLGAGPVHGTGREGLAVGRCSTPRRSPTSPTCTARSSRPPT